MDLQTQEMLRDSIYTKYASAVEAGDHVVRLRGKSTGNSGLSDSIEQALQALRASAIEVFSLFGLIDLGRLDTALIASVYARLEEAIEQAYSLRA